MSQTRPQKHRLTPGADKPAAAEAFASFADFGAAGLPSPPPDDVAAAPPAVAPTRGAYDSVLQTIGDTPLIRLNRIPQAEGLACAVYAKTELFNPGGSIKDRIALRMILAAEQRGELRRGDTVVEPTSGNTGIGLALVAAVRGYRAIIVMPRKMSLEKISVLRALGAEVIRTPTEAKFSDPDSHLEVAKRIVAEWPKHANERDGTTVNHTRCVLLDQYGNSNNPDAHYHGTAEEIWRQTGGRVTAVVAGAGTGGTITGLARGLAERNPAVRVVGVDPVGSILAQPEALNSAGVGTYHVEGIGYDFVPDVLERARVHAWVKTTDDESFAYARRLIREEGILVGGSSGSALAGAVRAARELGLGPADVVVVVFPDSIRSYLSKFASDEWMAEHGF
ncbi:pyridoxal phosphate-dependent enzyme, beta subunit, partial [Dipodascopsis tothii]|uniref:pyridoxal phosphate-dependent enzyme, beta subunit n=1 Tax=Dipodascopsis tothii TaxID=44089 RepID=UPI0034CD425D